MIKRILIISSLLANVTFAANTQSDDWKVSGRLNAYLQNIYVEGSTNTARTGTTHNEELNLKTSGPWKNGKAGVEARVRTTNDRQIQKNGAELLYLRSFYKNKIWTLEAGDVATSLNPYIFSGSVKGGKAVYKSPKKEKTWNYSVIGGFKKSSWQKLLAKESVEEPTGYTSAFEAKYIHERSKEIAISMAILDTDIASADSTNTDTGKRGYGVGVDGKWRFSKSITLKGRSAFTRGTDDVRNNKANSSDNAIYLKLLTRPSLKSVRSNFTYQRVGADFISYGGSGAKDKEQFENSTTWKMNKQYKVRMDLKTNQDNLNGALGETQKLYYEALALTYYPKTIKRANVNFKISNKDVDGRGADNKKRTAGVDFNIRKKDGWRYGAGYDYTDYTDKNTTANSQTTNIFKVLVGYKQKLSKDSSYRFTIRPSYQDVIGKENKFGLKLDAGYTHDKKLSMDLLYMTNQNNKATTNDTKNSTYQFKTKYKLDDKGKKLFRLLLEKRDVSVENDVDNSYNEYITKVSFVMNF